MTSQTPKRHDLEGLPQSVREIAEVIGRHEALFLIGKLPTCVSGADGKKASKVILYVPAKLKPKHRLAGIIGQEKAAALVQAFGGEILYPANCEDIYRRFRDASIRRMATADGMSPVEIAELFGMSVRQVRNIRRGNTSRGNPL